MGSRVLHHYAVNGCTSGFMGFQVEHVLVRLTLDVKSSSGGGKLPEVPSAIRTQQGRCGPGCEKHVEREAGETDDALVKPGNEI